MSLVKGTPVYRKLFLYDVIVKVKELEIPVYFLALSFADLKWEELPYIIYKLNNLRLSDEELKR